MAMEDTTLMRYPTQGLVLRHVQTSKDYLLSGEMLVGREVECAILLNSSQASRYHAKLIVSANGVYVEDLHSTNGTFINGKRTRGRIRLSLGDEVIFESVAFRLTSPQSGQADNTVLAPRQHIARPAPQPPRVAPSPPPAAPPIPATPRETGPSVSAPQVPEAANKESYQLSSPAIAVPPKPPAAEENQAVSPALKAIKKKTQEWAPESIDDIIEQRDADQGDGTQIMSSSQLQHRIKRNQLDVDIDVGSGPRFIIMTAPLRGKYYALSEAQGGAHWQLGRGKEAEIYLNDQTISTDHARITRDKDGYHISVTHAKNGISINGTPIKQARLTNNDKIQIGRTELIYRDDAPETTIPEADTTSNMSRYTLWVTLASIVVLVIALVTTSR